MSERGSPVGWERVQVRCCGEGGLNVQLAKLGWWHGEANGGPCSAEWTSQQLGVNISLVAPRTVAVGW
jgi:hypothetical protein